jgi:hypothetical protein
VIAVTAGNGYAPDAWVAFVAVNGYASPIAVGFDTFNVKVKGSPDGRIEVKLLGGGDDSVVEVNVDTYAGSTDLGDGWYELSIPFSEFSNVANIPLHTGWLVGPPGDQGDAAFIFLLTDVGFTNAGGGGTADPGTTPEFVLFGTMDASDIAIPDFVPDVSGPQNFGSGATFDFAYDQDTSFVPVIAVTAGNGYAPDVWVAFVAVTGYASPIAIGYDTFNVKVKGTPDDRIEVKLIGGGADSVIEVNVGTYAGSTDLGDGWFELSIPFSEFSNVANIPLHTGWLVGPPGDQGDAAFIFLLTDVGFTNAGGGGGGGGGTADPGTTPGFVLFGTTATEDVAIPDFVPDVSGPQNFGSGASFDFAYDQDTSFVPVIAVTAGNGYAPDVWVAFVAVNGYASPIAAGFDTFNVKVKGSPDGRIEVKLIGGGADSVVEVNVDTYAGSTDLGDGWYELSIPFSEFSNPGNIFSHTGWLIGPPGDQGDAAFIFLLTDVGFSNISGGG